MSAVEPAAPPAGPLHAEKMYATPGSARYAVAPREDGLCDDKSESLFKYILSFVLDCPKLSIRFVQRFLSVNIKSQDELFAALGDAKKLRSHTIAKEDVRIFGSVR